MKSSACECLKAKRVLRLAYLTTEYPAVSHTFIRRELREIERRGHSVLRLAIRKADAPLADRLDQEEETKTLHCLSQPTGRLLLGMVRTVASRPIAFLRAAGLAIQMGWRSERGLLRHVAYLAEAAYLATVLREHRVQHVHVHFGTNAAAVARLIRRLGGPSYSFTVHGPDEFDSARSFDLCGKAKDAAFVVAISHFCVAQLRRWVPFEQWPKIQIVHCTVGNGFFDQAQPICPDSRTLVCVGRLCPQKGQLMLIEAMCELLHSGIPGKLVLAGDGEMRPIIEKRIRELSLSEHVIITGWIDEAEVRRQILSARALVLPSLAEGLPMVIMEAFALGRPVISTHIAAIPELVRPGVSGWLVTPSCVSELVAAMREVYESPIEQLGRLAASGRRLVETRHHSRIETGRLEELFLRHVDDET